jgi:hypothetical protein
VDAFAARALSARQAGRSLDLQEAVPEVSERIAAIKDLVVQMYRLRSDLLDIASIEAGHLSVEPRPLELQPLVDAAVHAVLDRAELRWTTSANWSTNSNRLVSLSDETFQPEADFFYAGHTGEPIQISTHRVCVGERIGNFFGYESVGINEQGEWLILDQDDEVISIRDATSDDRRVLGNGLARYNLAWNNSARLGSFDLSVNMRGAFGFQVLNFQRLYYENPRIIQYNMLESAFEPVYGKRPVDYDLSYVSYYIEDGDYWKLDDVTLGYTLGPDLLAGLPGAVSNARVYISGRNLYTLTGYKGLDPEVSTSGDTGLNPGSDHRDKYPTTRMFTAGVSVTF